MNLPRIRELLEAWNAGAAREADLAELRGLLPATLEALTLPADVEAFVAEAEAKYTARAVYSSDLAEKIALIPRALVIIRAQGAENATLRHDAEAWRKGWATLRKLQERVIPCGHEIGDLSGEACADKQRTSP
jgi:hypothetical protein